jgi:hypothetical protein
MRGRRNLGIPFGDRPLGTLDLRNAVNPPPNEWGLGRVGITLFLPCVAATRAQYVQRTVLALNATAQAIFAATIAAALPR